jgi:alkylated DNA repair dioxygenase AlkB
MNDLFAQAERGLEQLPLPDADVRFQRVLYPAAQCRALLGELIDETPWRHEQITLHGKSHWQPRLVALHGDAGLAYTYSGLTLPMQPWTPLLSRLRQDIENIAGASFNSVLLNWYRDEQDSMSWHSDDETSLGTTPVIASLSLGATRLFKLKHKTRAELSTTKLALTDGSLLLMAGSTQRCWKHAVDKSREACDARINLTFRRIIQTA